MLSSLLFFYCQPSIYILNMNIHTGQTEHIAMGRLCIQIFFPLPLIPMVSTAKDIARRMTLPLSPLLSFPTLLPCGPVVVPLALEQGKVLVSLPVAGSTDSSRFSFFARVLTRDHAPPVQDCVFSPAPPRSPPHFV